MSFSVQAQRGDGQPLVWSGTSLGSLFAKTQPASPRFWGMLADLLRFNAPDHRPGPAWQRCADAPNPGRFLDEHRFGRAFRQWYFMPMMACIWSPHGADAARFPVATMVRFCHNHGLLPNLNRPQWWTVQGGARRYVQPLPPIVSDVRLATPVHSVHAAQHAGRSGVAVHIASGSDWFDRVILATHSDQALALLADASAAERAALGAIGCQPNEAVLHTDTAVMPPQRAAWASHGTTSARPPPRRKTRVCLHHWINQPAAAALCARRDREPEPGAPDCRRQRCCSASPTPTRCSIWPPCRPKSRWRRCRPARALCRGLDGLRLS